MLIKYQWKLWWFIIDFITVLKRVLRWILVLRFPGLVGDVIWCIMEKNRPREFREKKNALWCQSVLKKWQLSKVTARVVFWQFSKWLKIWQLSMWHFIFQKRTSVKMRKMTSIFYQKVKVTAVKKVLAKKFSFSY